MGLQGRTAHGKRERLPRLVIAARRGHSCPRLFAGQINGGGQECPPYTFLDLVGAEE